MQHILILLTIGFMLFCTIIVFYMSYFKSHKILKYIITDKKRYWYKILVYHPLSIMFLIIINVITFFITLYAQGISMLEPSNTRIIGIIISVLIAINFMLILTIITILHQKVPVMKTRKLRRIFSKIYKENLSLYMMSKMNLHDQVKLTYLQIQLYSKNRITSKQYILIKTDYYEKYNKNIILKNKKV